MVRIKWKDYNGNQRLEAASKRGLYYNLIGLKHIKTILEKNLDRLPVEQSEQDTIQIEIPFKKETFVFARDTSYFSTK